MAHQVQQCPSILFIRSKDDIAHIAGSLVGYILAVFACSLLHKCVFKRFFHHRIVTEFLVGILVGNFMITKSSVHRRIDVTLGFVSQAGMLCYMFVLGLEMEPAKLITFRRIGREHLLSFASLLSTLTLGFLVTLFTPLYKDDVPHPRYETVLAISITLAGTSSPVLTRLITNLKIGKSDIGKLVVIAGTHSDFVCTVVVCIAYLSQPTDNWWLVFNTVFWILVQILLAYNVGPLVFGWVNSENPEGKDMKGPHLVLCLAFLCIPVIISVTAGYSSILSVFITGVCLPRSGRMSRMIIGRVNYVLNHLFYPILFIWIGLVTNYTKVEPGRNVWSFAQLCTLFALAAVGKVCGTLVSGMMLGVQWPESIMIGLLLAVKGYFHMYVVAVGVKGQFIYVSTGLMIILATFFTLLYSPFVVEYIITRAKKRSGPNHTMALEGLNLLSELRIMLCIHKPPNVPATINLMEISRGPPDPGIVVYVTDMVELTEQVAATMVQKEEGEEGVTVMDKAVTEMRNHISKEMQTYVDDNGEGISLKRLLALSTTSNMHTDVCILAEASMVSLLILPFHKMQSQNGNLDAGHSGFQLVNKKILRYAPCTVGILVDRGLGRIDRISSRSGGTHISLTATVIFIGGRDDREALAYASRVAQHPGVRLSVIRFLVDSTNEDDAASLRAGKRLNAAQKEEEMKLDDESFAHFYERHVARGHVNYVEKYMVNSAETFTALSSLGVQYELIIVGKGGGRVNSILTLGMRDWEQCPELGPIGDILSSTHFSHTASVLVIQQHIPRSGITGLDDAFSVM